jgi:pimeloyl-ACP methyl ester carboxylesterase
LVQWDQRGAGRTLKKSGPSVAPTLTVDRMAQDGIQLAEYLRKHLGKDKIILVGHSFGSILGPQMVRTRPDLFYAYVGTGQVGDETKNYAAAYDALLKKARAAGNQRAIDELDHRRIPPVRDMECSANGQTRLKVQTSFCQAGQGFSADQLVPQTKSSGPKELGLKFSIPIFFFQGAEDFTTPTALARDYLDAIQAPRKEFVPIEGAGH